MMTQDQLERILEIGVALTAEKNLDSLLEKIVKETMLLVHCDACILYLKDDHSLNFRIMRKQVSENDDTPVSPPPIALPPVPLTPDHIAARAVLEDRIIIIDDIEAVRLRPEEPSLSSDIFDSQDFRDDIFGSQDFSDDIMAIATKSLMVVPLKNPSDEAVGVIQLINALDENGAVSAFSPDLIKAVASIASQAAVAISNAKYVEDIQLMFESFVETMVSAIGTKTPFNEIHTKRMASYGRKFFTALRGTPYELSAETVKELNISIWLHDVGKLVTPVDIMNKNTRLWPSQRCDVDHRLETFKLKAQNQFLKGLISEENYQDVMEKCDELAAFVSVADTSSVDDREARLEKYAAWRFTEEDGTQQPYLKEEEKHQLLVPDRTLTDEEFEIMHDHVVQTDHLLASIYFPSNMKHVRAWAASHHELLNGKGYPAHLTAEDIPKEVRILTILDIFEAMTAPDREYKRPKTPEEAFVSLHRMADEGALDAELLALFEESRCWE